MAQTGPILITGCSTGIGRASALRLAKKGHTVYATARRLESIADLADAGCTTLSLDVCDEESMRVAVKEIEQAHGAVYALVNNAGYGLYGAVETTSMEEIRREFETNVFGLVRLTQMVLPGMRRQRRGRIVNMSSMGGRFTLPGGGYYHATKHAVEALSDALRFEVKPWGIHVTVIEPGQIKTEFGNAAIETIEEEGPYAEFNAGVRRVIHSAYNGRMAMFAASADSVARVVERAVTSPLPDTRYRVTAGARFLIAMRRLMPDRVWDLMLRAQFRPPKPRD